MPAESEADAMEALKNLTEGFESVGGNKYTFKKSEATKAQEAYEKNQKKIASENKKKNSLENAKKEEAKAFAEKEYGGNAPRQLTGDCKITIKG